MPILLRGENRMSRSIKKGPFVDTKLQKKVEKVNDTDPDGSKKRLKFENLTPVFPEDMIILETTPKELSTRLMDIMSPVGRGQRGLIVSPPKAGKTTLLKQIANGITENAPDIHIMVALIGERPEEVTDMKRSIKGEVYSSTFDEPVEDHCRVCLLYTSPSPRDGLLSRMPSSA